MALDRGDGVRGARGGEAARRGEQRGYEALVGLDQGNEHCADRLHDSTPAFRSAAAADASRASGRAVITPARAMNTTSSPGHGPPARRQVSLRTLFARLRSTAPPIFFPATNITRPSGSRDAGVFALSTTSSGLVPLVALAKILSISAFAVIVRMVPGPLGPQTLLRCARGEDLAALTATRCDNRAATLGGHARTEPVRLGTLAVVGLVSTLHLIFLRSGAPVGYRPDAKPGDYTGALWIVSTRSRARRVARVALRRVASQPEPSSSAGSRSGIGAAPRDPMSSFRTPRTLSKHPGVRKS